MRKHEVDPVLQDKDDYFDHLYTLLHERSFHYVGRKHHEPIPAANKLAKLFAYYLPQFYPFPVNDEIWGKGFTEWTNVTKAQPYFKGHYQPHLPADLGFYDLRNPTTLLQQASLAKMYGIEGFCFYYYWFGGRKVMEETIEYLYQNPHIDLSYCVFWANEPWSTTWKLETEAIFKQPHGYEYDRFFIFDILKYLKDPRYLRIDNKPVVIMYRPNIALDILQSTQFWRDVCRREGVGEILLYMVEFELDRENPNDHRLAQYGFDGFVEFPPNGHFLGYLPQPEQLMNKNYQGYLCPYEHMVEHFLATPVQANRLRGVCTTWDNTARKCHHGTIYVNVTPEKYSAWLKESIRAARQAQGDSAVVFINAWNEWAEGCHLEPDAWYGFAYLEATRNALLTA